MGRTRVVHVITTAKAGHIGRYCAAAVERSWKTFGFTGHKTRDSSVKLYASGRGRKYYRERGAWPKETDAGAAGGWGRCTSLPSSFFTRRPGVGGRDCRTAVVGGRHNARGFLLKPPGLLMTFRRISYNILLYYYKKAWFMTGPTGRPQNCDARYIKRSAVCVAVPVVHALRPTFWFLTAITSCKAPLYDSDVRNNNIIISHPSFFSSF